LGRLYYLPLPSRPQNPLPGTVARTTVGLPSEIDQRTPTALPIGVAGPDVAIGRSDRMCEMRTEDRMIAGLAADRAMLGTIGAVPPAEDQERSEGVQGQAVTVLSAVQPVGRAVVSEEEISVHSRADAEPAHPLIGMAVPDRPHEPQEVPRNEAVGLPPRPTVVEDRLGRAEAASQGADEVAAATGALICGAARWIAIRSGVVVVLPGGTRTGEIKAAAVGGKG
jgi:hypothetical protein